MASLLISAFEGLTTEDFEVYAPKCWSNNLHNLDRMRTKDRLMALLDQIKSQLSGVEDLIAEATSEIPSVWNGRKVKDQWAYLIRGSEIRAQIYPLLAADMGLAARIQEPADHQRHAIVYIQIDQEGLTAGLTLYKHATIDLRNAIAQAEAEGLKDLIAAAAEAGLKINGEDASVEALVGRSRQALEGVIDSVDISRRWPQGEILDFGGDLADELKAIFEALVPIYGVVAWSPENDHAQVSARLEAFAETKARHEAEEAARLATLEAEHQKRAEAAQARAQEKAAEMAEWRARRRRPRPPMEEMGPSPRRAAEDEAAAEVPAEATEGGAEAASEQVKQPAQKKTAERKPAERKPAARKPAERGPKPAGRGPKPTRGPKPEAGERKGGERKGGKGGKPAAPSAPAADLKVGDNCRLLRGLFAGKEGTVTAVDKGMYEVKVGHLQVKVKAQELEAL